MLKSLGTCFVCGMCSMPFLLKAQPYQTAAGVRAGATLGLSVQQAIGEKFTIEMIAESGLVSKRTSVTALAQRHQKLLFRGVNFYVGAGPHVGFRPSTAETEGKPSTGRVGFGGLSMMGGAELKLGKTVISFDYKPALNLWGSDRLVDGGAAVSLRYILIKTKPKARKVLPNWWPRKGTRT